MIREWQTRIFSAVCGIAAATLLLMVGAPSALAQTSEPTAFKNVKIWVDPEYDDPLGLNVPSLLVMIEGEIVGPPTPVTIRFLVPTAASMYSAGSKNSFGEYNGGPPKRKASSLPGYDEISYQLTESTFRVEYYSPIGELGVVQKSFSYDFLRFYPVQDLSVFVQQPKSSDNFTLSSVDGQTGSPAVDADGLNIQTYKYTNLDVSTAVGFSISYNRSVWEPSLATSPTTSPSSGKSSSSTGLIVAIVVVAVVLGGGGVYLMTRNSQKSRPVSRAERRRRGATTGSRARASQDTPAFCSQCGRKLDRPSRFCPNCGAEI